MNRTVPQATSEEIQLYRTTLYSLLRSSAEIKIKTLEGVHAGMNSLMHPGAREAKVDISAFIYSAMRLPECIVRVRSVILGQNSDVFRRNGFQSIETWQPVSARARRRRCFYNGSDTLACFIASRSDIEDVIPSLTAFQMEWNKMHALMMRWPRGNDLNDILSDALQWEQFSGTIGVSPDDLERLRLIWREEFIPTLRLMREKELSIGVRLLGGSQSQYFRATHEWFENIKNAFPALIERPVYFISSNPHSLSNVLTGFALQHRSELNDFVAGSNDNDLQTELTQILAGSVRSSAENFYYYVLKKYQNTAQGAALIQAQADEEKNHGIIRIQSENTFDVEAQVFDLKQLDITNLDPRLKEGQDLTFLKHSDALILNIDYPLGLAAYNILSTVSIHTAICGIYSMGKSASLNGVVGDVIIPNVVQDEHSHNTYLFENAFSAADVTPYLKYGSVLDNQKAICVLGTFLQNSRLMDVFFNEGFADIEMEAGNFCSALFEAIRPKRFPMDEIVNLQGAPIDFGVLHYVSDTPLSKGKNLGAGTLSYFGMDSTYACSIAILKRVFALERQRIA